LAYTKTTWVNNSTPALNATNLNKIETGIEGAHTTADVAIPKTVVDAKGDLLVGTAADTAGRLAIGTNDYVLIADSSQALGVKWGQLPAAGIANSAVTSEKIADGAVTAEKLDTYALAKVGNLLTANQASGTDTLGNTTGFTAQNNCTLASSTAQALRGSRSLAVTATAAASLAVLTSQVAADPGQLFTASVACRAAAAGADTRLDLAFYASGGGWIATVNGTAVNDTTTGWTTLTVTGVAPSGAGLVLAALNIDAAGIGVVHYADCFGLWRGAGGQWAMPGTPIVHTGIRPNPANTAQVQVWNDATATWITV
jgi:hypothetical protein